MKTQAVSRAIVLRLAGELAGLRMLAALRPERERQANDATCWDRNPPRLTRLDLLQVACVSRSGRKWALKAYREERRRA